MRAQGIDPKGRSWFKKISEFVSTRFTRCGTENDVVTAAYNIPEPRSARPSGAPSSSMRWGEGRNTMPTLPRHDSSLPIHGQTSQVNAPDVGSTPNRLISWSRMHIQHMAHTFKDHSHICPHEGLGCPRRIVGLRQAREHKATTAVRYVQL